MISDWGRFTIMRNAMIVEVYREKIEKEKV